MFGERRRWSELGRRSGAPRASRIGYWVTVPCMNTQARSALGRWLLALGLAGTVAQAAALSYLPIQDADLADQVEAIVVGRIVEPSESLAAPDLTLYAIDVEQAIKGDLQPGPLTVVVPGSFDRGRHGALYVPGAPRFAAGERAMLFLHRRGDGRYAVSQLALGAFHLRESGNGRVLAVRQLDQAGPIGAGHGGEGRGRHRDFEAFTAWLQGRVRGAAGADDYWTEDSPQEPVGAKFSIDGAVPSRWAEFDEGIDVVLYAAGGKWGGGRRGSSGEEELLKAIRAWNEDPASGVRFAYGGISSAVGGLSQADGINTVLFNDPFDEILGSFDCILGGVMAYAGFRSGPKRSVNGFEFHPIVEADVVVQDGSACLLSGRNATAEELLAHELGHVLGFDHSCGSGELPSCASDPLLNDAIMRWKVHADGRGARLGADDRAGLSYLYPLDRAPPIAPTPTPTASPSGSVTAPGSAPSTAAGTGGGGSLGHGLLALALLVLRRRCGRLA